jgi:hypothetical protein
MFWMAFSEGDRCVAFALSSFDHSFENRWKRLSQSWEAEIRNFSSVGSNSRGERSVATGAWPRQQLPRAIGPTAP